MENIKSVYETIDFLAGKSDLFKMIQEEIRSKDEMIKAQGEVIAELDFRLMMGGM